MKIRFSRNFKKQRKKAPSKIKQALDKRIELFLRDPFSPQLRNHTLIGKYSGLRSINVTGDWRAIFKENNEVIIFLFLGTHSQLYK